MASKRDEKNGRETKKEKREKERNKFVRTKMRPKEGSKIELQRETYQIWSDLLDLQV